MLLISMVDKTKDEQISLKKKIIYRNLHDNNYYVWEILFTDRLDKYERSYRKLGMELVMDTHTINTINTINQVTEARKLLPKFETLIENIATYEYKDKII